MKTYHIKFYQNRKIYITISLAVMVAGLILNLILGTTLDIQFTGGAIIKYSYSGTIQQAEVETLVQDAVKKDVSVRIHEGMGNSDGNSVSISLAGTESITPDQQAAIQEGLTAKYPDGSFKLIESSSVNPTMGQSFFFKCLISVLITAVLLIGYVGIRFRKIGGVPAGVMSIVALLHDVLCIYFVYVIFQMPINDNFIAVVLTILGYSLNNTIVVYDRVRENRRLMGPKASIESLVDTSINQTLTRSINTSACTFAAVAVVYVVGLIYGLTSVTTFALPMMVGIAVGCYSSVCLAGPLYVMWQNYKVKRKNAPAKTGK